MAEAFASLLPPNSSAMEQALEAATARIGAVAVPNASLFDPWTCPASHLPWLAWQVSVDHWNSAWPDETKRRVIAASVEVHRRKGTVGAVRRALEALGAPPEIEEWWQRTPQGVPHTFSVFIWRHDLDDGVEITPGFLDDLIASINAAKPERSHFALYPAQVTAAAFGFAALAAPRQTLSADTPAHTREGAAAGIGFAGGGHAAPRLHAIARAA